MDLTLRGSVTDFDRQ